MTLIAGYQGADFAALLSDSMGFVSQARVGDFGVQRVTNPGDQGFKKEPKLTWAPHRRLVYAVSGACPDTSSTTPIDTLAVARKIHTRCLPFNKGDFGAGYKAYVHVLCIGSPQAEIPRFVRIMTWADETTITEAQPGDILYGGIARPDALSLGLEGQCGLMDIEAAINTLVLSASLLIERARTQPSPIPGVPVIDWPLRVAVITATATFEHDFEESQLNREPSNAPVLAE